MSNIYSFHDVFLKIRHNSIHMHANDVTSILSPVTRSSSTDSIIGQVKQRGFFECPECTVSDTCSFHKPGEPSIKTQGGSVYKEGGSIQTEVNLL